MKNFILGFGISFFTVTTVLIVVSMVKAFGPVSLLAIMPVVLASAIGGYWGMSKYLDAREVRKYVATLGKRYPSTLGKK